MPHPPTWDEAAHADSNVRPLAAKSPITASCTHAGGSDMRPRAGVPLTSASCIDADNSVSHAQASPVILKSLNTGLNCKHLELSNPYAYTFTEALVKDLRETFGPQQAQGLFLCEMGSQKPDQNIDTYFEHR